MPSAYTAKPAVTSSPSVPPGWNPIWPNPGPLPPGYEMDLSLSLEAQEQMQPGVTVKGLSLSLFDHVTFPTTEPQENTVWSATFQDNGESVLISNGGPYAETVEQDYSVLDPGWGVTPELDFFLSGADVGRTVVLECNSDPFGLGSLIASANILVVASLPDPVLRLEISGTVSVTGEPDYDYWYFSGQVYVYRGTKYKRIDCNYEGGESEYADGWQSSVSGTLAGAEATADEGAYTIDIAALARAYYLLKYKMSSSASNPGDDPPVPNDAVPFTITGTVNTYITEYGLSERLADTEDFEKQDETLGTGSILSLGCVSGYNGSISIY